MARNCSKEKEKKRSKYSNRTIAGKDQNTQIAGKDQNTQIEQSHSLE